MDDIKQGLLSGHVHVIDADLSKYFDTIPHDKLLKTVSQRIVDGSLLSLLKQWLKVWVVRVNTGRQTEAGGWQEGSNGYTARGCDIATVSEHISQPAR